MGILFFLSCFFFFWFKIIISSQNILQDLNFYCYKYLCLSPTENGFHKSHCEYQCQMSFVKPSFSFPPPEREHFVTVGSVTKPTRMALISRFDEERLIRNASSKSLVTFSIHIKRWFDFREREGGKCERPSWNYTRVKFWSEWNRLKVIFGIVSSACVVQWSAPLWFIKKS